MDEHTINCEYCEKDRPIAAFACEDEGWRYKICDKCRDKIFTSRTPTIKGWLKYQTCLIVRMD